MTDTTDTAADTTAGAPTVWVVSVSVDADHPLWWDQRICRHLVESFGGCIAASCGPRGVEAAIIHAGSVDDVRFALGEAVVAAARNPRHLVEVVGVYIGALADPWAWDGVARPVEVAARYALGRVDPERLAAERELHPEMPATGLLIPHQYPPVETTYLAGDIPALLDEVLAWGPGDGDVVLVEPDWCLP